MSLVALPTVGLKVTASVVRSRCLARKIFAPSMFSLSTSLTVPALVTFLRARETVSFLVFALALRGTTAVSSPYREPGPGAVKVIVTVPLPFEFALNLRRVLLGVTGGVIPGGVTTGGVGPVTGWNAATA